MTSKELLKDNIKKLLVKYPCPVQSGSITSVAELHDIRGKFYTAEKGNIDVHFKAALADGNCTDNDVQECIMNIVDKHFKLK